MDHPSLVKYFEAFIWHAGEWDEAFCLVMEYLEGMTLDQRIKEAPNGLPWPEVHTIFNTCLDGLIYASSMD